LGNQVLGLWAVLNLVLETIGEHMLLELAGVGLQARRGGRRGKDVSCIRGESVQSMSCTIERIMWKGEHTLDQLLALRSLLEIPLQAVRGALAIQVLACGLEGSMWRGKD
jgi:hypothetical protein